MSTWHLTYRTRAAAAKAWRLINLPPFQKTWENTYCVRLRTERYPFSKEFVMQEALMIEDLMVVCYSYDGARWIKVETGLELPETVREEVPLSGDLILLLASFLTSEVDLASWSLVSTLHRQVLGPRPVSLVSLVTHHLGRRYGIETIVTSLRNFPSIVQYCLGKGLQWHSDLASEACLLIQPREKKGEILQTSGFTLTGLMATLPAVPSILKFLLEGNLHRTIAAWS